MVTSSPGIQCAQEEDDQPHNALGIPPLCLDAGGAGGSDCCRPAADQTQQTRVTLTIYAQRTSHASYEKQVIMSIKEHTVGHSIIDSDCVINFTHAAD